ncbi:type IV pilus assembly protein PilM [Calderihabitans maritimus]|uniref:Type IV pilus assembly protein PilM n=1 Tax=Calderihabitans maritimus TaxID=1246530 RepID=A0A1Z5HX78_9FIRM|nr:type IV pilus assembly protein PilM [Calderihabitans maritimus]GAW94139.1 type IV pilus assembly protein PilM [Calderihabitans maritimus]
MRLLSRLWKRRKPALGIDVGTDSIKVVEVQRTGTGYDISLAVKKDVPVGALEGGNIQDLEVLVEVLRSLTVENGLQGRRVVSAISGEKVVIRHISVPYMSDQELKSSLKWDLDKYLPLSGDDLVIDYAKLGSFENENGRQLSVLLAAVPSSLAYRYYELFERAGLEVIAIDIVPMALARWLSLVRENEEMFNDPVALLDIGASLTTLAVIEQGLVTFIRSIHFGGWEITQMVAHTLGLEVAAAQQLKEEEGRIMVSGEEEVTLPEERQKLELEIAIRTSLNDLLYEIRRSLDYYNRQQDKAALKVLFLSGGTSLLPGLVEFLTQELEVETRLAVPSSPELQAAIDPSFAVATGLALREVVR